MTAIRSRRCSPCQPGSLAATYAAEHRGLLLIASGKETAGIAALDALPHPDSARASRLAIAAAATLDKRHKHDEALAMLVGDAPSVHAARAILAGTAGCPARSTPRRPGSASCSRASPPTSTSNRQRRSRSISRGWARCSRPTTARPGSSPPICSSLAGADQAALDALGHVAADDPFAGAMRDMRLTLLVRAGRIDQALAERAPRPRRPMRR